MKPVARVPTERITEERLADWTKRLNQDHATPIVLVGVGHDETSGQLVVCIPDSPDVTIKAVCTLLATALLNELRKLT